MNTKQTSAGSHRILGSTFSKIVLATLAIGMIGSTRADLTLTPVLDSTIPMPGAATNFRAFGAPGLDQQGRFSVVGTGNRSDGSIYMGLYVLDAGTLANAATYDTEIPDAAGSGAGLGNFALFQETVPTSGGAVAFKGYDSTFSYGRLYSDLDGTLRLILGEDIAVPDAAGTPTASSFTGGNVIGFSSAGVVVRGFGSGGERGFYEWSPSGYRVLVDRDTVIPGLGTLGGFNNGATDGDELVFQGLDSGVVGVAHRDASGTIRTVASNSSPIPDGVGNFTNMASVDTHAGEVAFRGFGSSGQRGIYVENGGALVRVADLTTPDPDGTAGLTNFGDFALLDGRVVFRATRSDGSTGLYAFDKSNEALSVVLAAGHVIDGSTVREVYIVPPGATDNSLGLSVQFTSGLRALYVASFAPSNEPPVAEAGLSREAAVGESIQISGLGSTDDTTPTAELGFNWTLVSQPSGSTAVLDNNAFHTADLRPDIPGIYTVELVVIDAEGIASEPDRMQLQANIEPSFVFTKIYDGGGISLRDSFGYSSTSDYMETFDSREGRALLRSSQYMYEYDYTAGTQNYLATQSIEELVDESIEPRLFADSSGTALYSGFYNARYSESDHFRFGANFRPSETEPYSTILGETTDEGVRTIETPSEIDGYRIGLDTRLSNSELIWLRGSNSTCLEWRTVYYADGRSWTYCGAGGQAIFELQEFGATRVLDNANVTAPGGGQFYYFYQIDRTPDGDLIFIAAVKNEIGRTKTGLFKYSSGSEAEILIEPGSYGSADESYIRGFRLVGDDVIFSGRFRSDEFSDTGIFRISNGVIMPLATTRNSPVHPSDWFQANENVVIYSDNRYESAWWLEDGVVTKIATKGDSINGVAYDWIWPSGNRAASPTLDNRSSILGATIEIFREYSSETGYLQHYEYEDDVFIARFDSDRDGIGDDVDNCPHRPNEDQLDLDGNGIGDVCEDSDADGVEDIEDNCPLYPNTNQENSDGDDYGNACDLCPDTAGESQADQNENGVGDLCDPDIDGDGYDNDVDNCPVVFNDQANLDGDFEGDACDADIDGDGIDNRVDGRYESGGFIDESEIESDEYTDEHLGGVSFGRIINRGGLEFRIYDSPDPSLGLLAETFSGAGQLRIKTCDLKGPPTTVDLVPDSEVLIPCASIIVEPLRGHAFLLVDETVLIHTPAGTKAHLRDTNTSEILLDAEAVSGLPVTMVIDEETQVLMEGNTLVHAEPDVAGQYVIENDETSLNPITVVSGGIAMEYAPGDLGLLVAIDIKPDSDDNTINLGSNGVVPVAILSDGSFDATDVDPLTVRLASSEVRLKGKGTAASQVKDVNADGLDDLVVQVETENLVLQETDSTAKLTGTTYSGVAFIGEDGVTIVPPN